VADGVLHVGMGNPLRRDDGVGPWLARDLAAAGLRARAWPADGAGLIDLFAAEPRLVLIDATRSDAAPGTVHRFDALCRPLPRPLFHNSTHEFGLAEAVEVARRLGQLPTHLIVFGIDGEDFGWGAGMSRPVLRAAEALAAQLKGEAARG
jgi:hydrogenase maturation protease